MNISPALSRSLNRGLLQIQKYSPQILTAAGIGALVAAGVIAAKQTLKLEEVLEESKDRIENVEDDESKTKAYAANLFALAKLYAVPVTLGATGVIAILVGHNILHKRNLAIIGAYKGLEQAFAEYRKRVSEEHGAEADEKYRLGIREVTEVDAETGKKTKSQKVDPVHFDYVFSFGPENDNWQPGPNGAEHNLFFVGRFEKIFNDMLQVKGHVFLNEVLDALGIGRTKAGQVTGWVWKKGTGDDYIDFRIKDLQTEHGYILLDFNVDGVILDDI